MHEDDDEPTLPPPHPRFAAHFTDPLYADLGEELAPFGSDEGFDLLFEWRDRADELGSTSTVADVVEVGYDELAQIVREQAARPAQDEDSVDPAVILVASAFVLLRFTGRIDPEGYDLAVVGLERLVAAFGPRPELLTQLDDLRSWPRPEPV